MDDKIQKPDIRFSGFTDFWGERKFGELLNEVKRPIEICDDKEYNLVTVKRRNGGVVSRGVFKGKDILVKTYYELRAGDYLISKRQVVHGANGLVPNNLDGAAVSNEYLASVGNEKVSTDFLALISFLPQMYKLFFLSSYGVDIEKLVFDVEDWKKRDVSIPSLDEQKEITRFFKQLDRITTLQQREYEKTINFKKAMLEKMFPKEGSEFPEVRFKGFTEPWERFRLSDVVERINKHSNSNELPKVEFEDISAGKGCLNKDVSQKFDNRTGIEFEPNDILFGKLRPYLKNWLMPKFRGVALGDFWVLRARECSTSFIYTLIQTEKYQKAANDTIGTKMPRSDWKKVSNTVFYVPQKIQEQEEIGSIFVTLDNMIIIQQRELEKLKNIKKALLEKMFV